MFSPEVFPTVFLCALLSVVQFFFGIGGFWKAGVAESLGKQILAGLMLALSILLPSFGVCVVGDNPLLMIALFVLGFSMQFAFSVTFVLYTASDNKVLVVGIVSFVFITVAEALAFSHLVSLL